MKNIGNVPGERLAGIMADIFHKVQHGGITVDELALFAQRKNPFEFERNEHGHIVLSLTGLDLTGEQEIARHRAWQKAKMNDGVKSCLLSQNDDGYDKNHHLAAIRASFARFVMMVSGGSLRLGVILTTTGAVLVRWLSSFPQVEFGHRSFALALGSLALGSAFARGFFFAHTKRACLL